MISSEIRANAREALKGKWGKAALMVLCYSLIIFVGTFLLNLVPVIGSFCYMIISIPISYGLLVSFIKLKRDEEIGYVDFLSIGFSSFGKVWGVFGNTLLKIIIPIILVIVFIMIFVFSTTGSMMSLVLSDSYYSASSAIGFGGIAMIALIGYIASLIYLVIRSYNYVLSFYLLYDHPDKTSKEIVEESEILMKGNRWSFFWLGLTFIGWAILTVFTLYIGLLWFIPYVMVSFVCFYEALSKKETMVETNSNDTPSNDDENLISE